MTSPNWQSMFASTFVDEIVRNGITDAVMSPGKRSTLVATALERAAVAGRLRTHVIVDERSASFFALGLARSQGRPVLVWCTSGTAAAELHPAILEASYARVPLLIATGDRPPEQRAIRDWQSMDQTHLYGRATRWFFDFGVADEAMSQHWRSIISRAVSETSGGGAGAGPVHLNVPIREPFSLLEAEAVPGRPEGAPWHVVTKPVLAAPESTIRMFVECASGRKGVFVLGAAAVDADLVQQASERLGWPVLTTPRSPVCGNARNALGAAHALVRDEAFARSHVPEIVVHVGDPLISRPVTAWLKASGAVEWSVEPGSSWQGETQRAAHVVSSDLNAFFESLIDAAHPASDRSWLNSWLAAEAAAQSAITHTLEVETLLSEPAIARNVVDALPNGSNLFVSTSMPVRDVDWWSKPRTGVRVWANRGVSGLDGVTSTALGIAAASDASETNVLLIGDLGVLHDLNGLWANRGSSADLQLVIIVVDNNGGGIFRLFPMADEMGESIYSRVVGTPQDVNIAQVAQALDIEVVEINDITGLRNALDDAIEAGGVRMIYCNTDSRQNVAVATKLYEAVSSSNS